MRCVAICHPHPRLSCLPSSGFLPQSWWGRVRAYCHVTSGPKGLWNLEIYFLSLFLRLLFSLDASVSCPGEVAEETGVEGEECVKLLGLALVGKH